jgi:hypothetical protein
VNSSQAARIDALLDQVQKIDLTDIADEGTRAIVGLLLNLVEDLRGELKKAHQEIAYLRERLDRYTFRNENFVLVVWAGSGGGFEADGFP